MCFPAISTGKPADIFKRALIHRALIVFKTLIKDILLYHCLQQRMAPRQQELFMRNVGAAGGFWYLRTSDPSTNYDLDHQLRVKLSLRSASVTPEGQVAGVRKGVNHVYSLALNLRI